MPRLTPPTPHPTNPYTEVAYGGTGNAVSASISWSAGDIITVICVVEGTSTVAVPTATGLTFASQKSNTAANTCNGRVSTAIAGSSGSGAVTTVITGANKRGMGVWVDRGSDGVGNSAEQHTSTRTVALAPTDVHSAFRWTVADFAAGATTSVVLTPTPTATQESAQQAGAYTVYSGNLDDLTTAASTSFGTSGGTVTGPSTILVQEILGTANLASVLAPPPRR